MSLRAFFASPFRDEFRWIRNAVATAARMMNVELRVVDEVVPPGSNILTSIHQEIEEADFGIALLSTLNPNVVYEVGRLLQASKPTILLADNETFKELPFDLRTFAFLVYSAAEKDEKGLIDVIARSIAQVREALNPETRSHFRTETPRPIKSATGQQVSTFQAIDFENIRREAERRMGKSDCTTHDIVSYDTGSFKGWNQTVGCPCGDEILIIVDLNGNITRTRVK